MGKDAKFLRTKSLKMPTAGATDTGGLNKEGFDIPEWTIPEVAALSMRGEVLDEKYH